MGEDWGDAGRNTYYVDEMVLLPISSFLIDLPGGGNWDYVWKAIALFSTVFLFPLTEKFSTTLIL